MRIIHQQKQKTYFILVAIYIIIAGFLLFTVLAPQNFFGGGISQGNKIVLLVVAVIDLILFWSFSELNIKVTEENLIFGFGVFKKKISFKQINDCLVEEFNKNSYLGYGIRFGRDKSIGYIARAGRGVRLKMQPRDYFISCDSPEQLVQVIKQQLFKK